METEHIHHLAIEQTFAEIANKTGKSITKVKNLTIIKPNNTFVKMFWNIIDNKFPNNNFDGIYSCECCGMFCFDEVDVDGMPTIYPKIITA